MDSIRKQTADFFRNTAKNGLEIRHGQVEMADEVCTAFEKQLPLAVEAEVGIGKSLAYLVPAILKIAQDHRQIVIATSTIALQEQLNRDAHNVLKMLGVNIDIVVAKGMKKYICKRRLKGFVSRNKQDFTAMKLWDIVRNGSQDIAKINMKIPYRILNCAVICNFGSDRCQVCDCSNSCEYSEIRKRIAEGKNIVICNQNMLVSHLLKSTQYQCVFSPECSEYIVDESHNIEEKFRSVFTKSYSGTDMINELNRSKIGENKLAKALLKSIGKSINLLFERLEKQVCLQKKETDSSDIFSYFPTKEIKKILDEINCKLERFERFIHTNNAEISEFVKQVAMNSGDDIIWLENGKYVRICVCKKDIRNDISNLLFSNKTVILTSATISDKQKGTPKNCCGYFLKSIGFPENGIVPEPKKSPFNYDENAMLYISKIMPIPKYDKKEEYCEKSIVEIVQLLEITQGKTLILFTSKSDMEYVYRKLSNMNLPYKILIQSGGSSQAYQLKRFTNDVNSVILGSGTYWEGINIEGESLSQVIIYKLPFPYPDPIISCKMVETNDPLMEIAVPEMIIKLRQGIGRLIRSESDKGIVSILDPRISSKSKSRYKKAVFDAIPIKNKTEDMAVLSDFWSKINGGQNEKIRTGRPDDFSCQAIHFGADERCSGKSEEADRGKMLR